MQGRHEDPETQHLDLDFHNANPIAKEELDVNLPLAARPFRHSRSRMST
jgi:hypothetical protein